MRDAERLPVELPVEEEPRRVAADVGERRRPVERRVAVDVGRERREAQLDGEVLRRLERPVLAAEDVLPVLLREAPRTHERAAWRARLRPARIAARFIGRSGGAGAMSAAPATTQPTPASDVPPAPTVSSAQKPPPLPPSWL